MRVARCTWWVALIACLFFVSVPASPIARAKGIEHAPLSQTLDGRGEERLAVTATGHSPDTVARVILASASATTMTDTEPAATDDAELELNSLKELAGKQLGATSGSVYSTLTISKIDGVEEQDFVYFDSPFDAMPALKAGKIDAYISGKAVAELMVARNSGLAIMPEEIANDDIGICLRKNSPLTEQFNERIAAYTKDGTLDALHDKWMGADDSAKVMPPQDWDAPNGNLNVICSTLDPMSYVDGAGETKGYEAELILCIARDLGYSISFSNAPFPGVLAAIESGKADAAIGNITITEERSKTMDFTDPDYNGGVVAIVATADDSADGNGGFIEGIVDSFQKTFVEEGRWMLILSGLGMTVLISVCSGILGVILGFVVVLVRRGDKTWAKKLVDAYQALMGGVPLVVVLMVLYYVVFGSLSIPGSIVAIVAFMLSFGSTAGATMWTAVDGIDIIQEETGLALGYTRNDVFRKIVFPQAMQQFLPQLMGQFVSLVKDTAIVGYIAVQDLTRASDLIRSRTMDAFFPLISSAIIYFLICRLLAWTLGRIAAKVDVTNRSRKVEGVVEK